jgi:hypothetical protein
MAADRARIAAALAREEQRRRLMESVPSTERVAPAPQSRNLRRDLENLSIGVGEGITNQLEGLKGIVTDPVGAVKAGYETVKGVVRDPSVLADALRFTADKAMSGPLGAGEVVGEFLTPSVKGVGKRDIFIGENAKTWDAAAAKRAEEMEAAGTDVGTIWRETGTFRAPDGQWRQEISDADVAFIGQKGGFGGYTLPSGDYPKTPLDLLPHQKLKEAYPDIENIRISQPQKLPGQPDVGQRGSYAPPRKQKSGEFNTEMISMHDYEGATPQDLRLTLIHELQHAVQEREPGFTQGSSPTQFRQLQGPQQAVMLLNEIERYKVLPGEAIRRFEKAYKRRPDIDAIGLMNAVLERRLTRKRLDELNLGPYEKYRRAGGEAEARAVEARVNLTPEERRKKFPLQSYDVPINEIHHPIRR